MEGQALLMEGQKLFIDLLMEGQKCLKSHFRDEILQNSEDYIKVDRRHEFSQTFLLGIK